MTVTSFSFLVFVVLGAIIYYIIPKSMQWMQLVLMSVIFYCVAATPYTLVYMIVSTVMAYGVTFYGIRNKKVAKLLVALAIVINIALWFVLKGGEFWYPLYIRIIPDKELHIIGALGMGYYTLQVIGYILDCYWGTVEPQSNPIKLFLFVGFFPQLITGPISRYSQLESLYKKHDFQYEQISFGAQRILWGLFKKLVLAERVALIVNAIYADPIQYTGWFHWIALLLYPIQMYADFSGGMDIVIGVAQIFGITLPENFNNPFFSRNSQEFWQRWHMTLGAWAKDYVLFPLLKTNWLIQLGRKSKKKFGKRIGKLVPTMIGMACLWLVMGIWHGNVKFIIGVSLWYWIILMSGEILVPVFQWLNRLLCIRTDTTSWHLFQASRTYLIYAVGAVFFRSDNVKQAYIFLKGLLDVFSLDKSNPWVLFNGSVFEFGITRMDCDIIVVALLFLLLVGIIREKYGYARVWIEKQILPFRWMIWIGLLLSVLIYGKYGPGYDAAAFIYQGF